MHARMANPAYLVPEAGHAIGDLMRAMQHDMEKGIVPAATLMLAAMRGSQTNGGSACLYADAAEARKAGVTDDQLITVAAWRQSPYFTDAERAALALAATSSTPSTTSSKILPAPPGTNRVLLQGGPLG